MDAHINSLLNDSWFGLGFEDRDSLRQAQTHTIMVINLTHRCPISIKNGKLANLSSNKFILILIFEGFRTITIRFNFGEQ